MIRGIFSLQRVEGANSLAISVFSECCKVNTQKASGFNSRSQDHIKNFFSEEASLGFLIGDNMKRSVFCSYSCESFLLEHIASTFLFTSDESFEDFVLKTEFKRTNPFLMIFVEGLKAMVVSCYGKHDFHINVLKPGNVNITDFMIHSIRKDDEESQYILAAWREDISQYQNTSSCLVKSLQNKIVSWPPPTGLGITLLKMNNRSIVTISDPGCKKINNSLPRPKGPVSSFNYFCMAARRQSNNFDQGVDGSKMLGLHWNGMTEEQKEPYVELARHDHIRYTEEMEAEKAQLAAAGKSTKQKPNTAYNLFIVQEKQFLFGLNIPDAQTRLGKHGSDRWAKMSVAERELYLVQREVELANAAAC